MSGGSFNYLCHAAPTDLFNRMEDLREMAAELFGLGHLAKDPASRTEELIEYLREVEAELEERMKNLEPIWHAVEWWRSCDWGQDQVYVAIGEYRERQKLAAQKGERAE